MEATSEEQTLHGMLVIEMNATKYFIAWLKFAKPVKPYLWVERNEHESHRFEIYDMVREELYCVFRSPANVVGAV